MKTVYFISGLGADKRVFYQLNLPNISPVYIEWVQPDVTDTIASYALKLLPQIDTNKPIILIGLSFGGMVAVELSKHFLDCQVILLSSAVSKAAIPAFFLQLGKWKIPNKIPFSFFQQTNALTYYFFGVKTKANKALLKEVLQETDEHFFRWALGAILSWENTTIPTNLTMIHGTKDKIIPINQSPNLIRIEGGGHFMVLEQAKEVSALLNKIL